MAATGLENRARVTPDCSIQLLSAKEAEPRMDAGTVANG